MWHISAYSDRAKPELVTLEEEAKLGKDGATTSKTGLPLPPLRSRMIFVASMKLPGQPCTKSRGMAPGKPLL